MALTLYAHPFSSYSQKVLVALWENDTPFDYRNLEEPGANEERVALWPLGQFPVLRDGDRTIAESSIILEHLDLRHPGPVRLIPEDRDAALEVRLMDRVFDNHVMAPMQKAVGEAIRSKGSPREDVLAEARGALDRAYAWLEQRMSGQVWAAAGRFTMADCAAAPALFYADWVQPIGAGFANLRDYRARLLARPSFARAVEEARPYRSYFPLGAPDRD